MRCRLVSIFSLFASAAFGQTADRVFHYSNLQTARDSQEVSTVIRSIADISHITNDFEKRELVVSGTSDQVAMAEWLMHELETPQGGRSADPHELRVAGNGEDIVRVVYLTSIAHPQQLQEISTVIRSTLEMRRMFPISRQNAIVFRANREQTRAAEWMIRQLDKPAGEYPARDFAAHESQLSSGDDRVRIYFITNVQTSQGLQELSKQVRLATRIGRMFVSTKANAIVARGTAAELEQADHLIRDGDK